MSETPDLPKWLRAQAEIARNSPRVTYVGDMMAAAFFEQCAIEMETSKRTTFALVSAIRGLLPLLEAVRLSVGFGKNQLARIEAAKAAIASYGGAA